MEQVQDQVQAAIDELVGSGAERGVQVAAYRHGELLVDAVAGVADPRTGRLVTPDTPFYNWSIGKGATSTVVHVLAERGALTYDLRIADVWPEFAAHGKGAATLRQALTHTLGVPGLPPDTTPEDVCDWQRMCDAVAAAEPWWAPGTKMGYHAYTFGFVVGEVVRRVTGRPISQVLREEVAGPLGVADELWFGMPTAAHGRVARLEDAEGSAEMMASIPADSTMFKAAPRQVMPDAALGNRADLLAADIPAGGKVSARAIARMYAALMDEVDGVRLVSPERLREVSAVASSGEDEVYGGAAEWGLGYGIGYPWGDPAAGATVFGMAGAGGSWAGADTATGVALAVTKNRMSFDFDTVTRLGSLITRRA